MRMSVCVCMCFQTTIFGAPWSFLTYWRIPVFAPSQYVAHTIYLVGLFSQNHRHWTLCLFCKTLAFPSASLTAVLVELTDTTMGIWRAWHIPCWATGLFVSRCSRGREDAVLCSVLLSVITTVACPTSRRSPGCRALYTYSARTLGAFRTPHSRTGAAMSIRSCPWTFKPTRKRYKSYSQKTWIPEKLRLFSHYGV